jgi:hypothetical protein
VALADPRIRARLVDLVATPLALSPADFGKLISDETEKWAKVVRAINIGVGDVSKYLAYTRPKGHDRIGSIAPFSSRPRPVRLFSEAHRIPEMHSAGVVPEENHGSPGRIRTREW